MAHIDKKEQCFLVPLLFIYVSHILWYCQIFEHYPNLLLADLDNLQIFPWSVLVWATSLPYSQTNESNWHTCISVPYSNELLTTMIFLKGITASSLCFRDALSYRSAQKCLFLFPWRHKTCKDLKQFLSGIEVFWASSFWLLFSFTL